MAEALLFATGSEARTVAGLDSFAASVERAGEHRSPEAQAVIALVLDAVERHHPETFGDLDDDIRSGDPYRVESALVRLSDAVHDALEREEGAWGEAPTSGTVPPQAAVVVFVAAAVVTAAGAVVAVTVGSAVNAVHAANVVWTVNHVFSARSEGATERAVAEITRAFAA